MTHDPLSSFPVPFRSGFVLIRPSSWPDDRLSSKSITRATNHLVLAEQRVNAMTAGARGDCDATALAGGARCSRYWMLVSAGLRRWSAVLASGGCPGDCFGILYKRCRRPASARGRTAGHPPLQSAEAEARVTQHHPADPSSHADHESLRDAGG